MSEYLKEFKNYFKDLSEVKSFYGGGSASALSFCIGCSLLEKAINYSFLKSKTSKSKLKKAKKILDTLKNIKAAVGKIIDLDGRVFAKILTSEGKEKIKYINESEKLIDKIAFSCAKIFSLAKQIEFDIKKTIISDFYIGKHFIYLSLCGCVYNLEANKRIFSKNPKNLKFFKILKRKYGKDF